MKNKAIAVVIGLLLSQSVIFAFANESNTFSKSETVVLGDKTVQDGEIRLQSINAYTLKFSRKSATVGIGSLQLASSGKPDSITATIRLQVAARNSTAYKNASASAITAKVTNRNTLSRTFTFNVTTSKNYRVKATVTEKVKGNTFTYTYYKKLS